MPAPYLHLDLDECCKIACWHEAKVPTTEIAARLRRYRSTILRELLRNRFVDPESCQHMRDDLSPSILDWSFWPGPICNPTLPTNPMATASYTTILDVTARSDQWLSAIAMISGVE